MFDKLVLMADGYIVYQGEASQSVQFFKQCGLVCPAYSNPSDFFLRELDLPYPRPVEAE